MRFSAEVTLLAAVARELEGGPPDALDFIGVIDLSVDRALLAVAEVPDLLRLAEIDAAGQLAHDHDVEPLDDLGLQRRSRRERRIADRGPQVGVKAEFLAQAQKPRLGPNVISDAVPFRTADGGQKNRVGGFGERHVSVADRFPVGVIGAPADQSLLDLEFGDALLVEAIDNLLEFGHNLGTDAVAREKQELESRHGSVTFMPGESGPVC